MIDSQTLGIARDIVDQELAHRELRAAWLTDALRSAADLIDYPRARWAPPQDAYDNVVWSLAIAARRVEGRLGLKRPEALAVLRQAVESFAR